MEKRILPPEWESPPKLSRRGRRAAAWLFALFTIAAVAGIVWLGR